MKREVKRPTRKDWYKKYTDRKQLKKEAEEAKIICKEFGCAKNLTAMEYLMSEYCFAHAQNKNK